MEIVHLYVYVCACVWALVHPVPNAAALLSLISTRIAPNIPSRFCVVIIFKTCIIPSFSSPQGRSLFPASTHKHIRATHTSTHHTHTYIYLNVLNKIGIEILGRVIEVTRTLQHRERSYRTHRLMKPMFPFCDTVLDTDTHTYTHK